jgi:hypothetical protein
MEDDTCRKNILAEKFSSTKTAKTFINILEKYSKTGATLKFIGKEFQKELDVEWTDGTAAVHCKILLDWTRKCDKVPKIFVSNRRKK